MITYQSGEHVSQIDYILTRKRDRQMVIKFSKIEGLKVAYQLLKGTSVCGILSHLHYNTRWTVPENYVKMSFYFITNEHVMFQ